MEKYQHQEELRKDFKLWRVHSEEIFNDQVSQETSSSDFNIKDEFMKKEYDRESDNKDLFDKESYDKELFDQNSLMDKDDDSLSNVIKQFTSNQEFISTR